MAAKKLIYSTITPQEFVTKAITDKIEIQADGKTNCWCLEYIDNDTGYTVLYEVPIDLIPQSYILDINREILLSRHDEFAPYEHIDENQ